MAVPAGYVAGVIAGAFPVTFAAAAAHGVGADDAAVAILTSATTGLFLGAGVGGFQATVLEGSLPHVPLWVALVLAVFVAERTAVGIAISADSETFVVGLVSVLGNILIATITGAVMVGLLRRAATDAPDGHRRLGVPPPPLIS